MTVFKYMDEKDVFQKMYATLLARRLIFDNSVSSEREANMLARLKVHSSARSPPSTLIIFVRCPSI